MYLSKHTTQLRLAALAGVAGVGMLGLAIGGLTLAQYEFLRSLGWHPLQAPTHDWPSGLALGPLGALMTGTFITSGILCMVFAAGLRQALRPQPGPGPWLFAGSGLALLLLASPTDPTNSTLLPTWSGRLHDAAFVLLGLTFLTALPALALRFRRDTHWRGLAPVTLIALLLVAPAFVLKGAFFYLFLLIASGWALAVALRLYNLTRAAV